MPTIKTYQQGKLASSQVGTAGVNPAGGEMVNAALATTGSQIQNQEQLNAASMGSENKMRGAALDTTNTIDQAMLHGRQVAIENQNALMQNQNEFLNRATNLRGANTAALLGDLGQAVYGDEMTLALRKRQAEEKLAARAGAAQHMQDVLDVKDAMLGAVGPLKDYGASINQQIMMGSLNAEQVGQKYKEGVGPIIEDINKNLPGQISDNARMMVQEHLADFQLSQSEGLMNFAEAQTKQNTANRYTGETSGIAEKAGITPYIDPATGRTYPAGSEEELTAKLAATNNRQRGQILVSGVEPGNKIIQDSKRQLFLNWAAVNIKNGNTDRVESYLTPGADGRMKGEKFFDLSENNVTALNKQIKEEKAAQQQEIDENDKHLEVAARNNLATVIAKAKSYPGNAKLQQATSDEARREIADLLKDPPSSVRTAKLHALTGVLDVTEGNIKDILAAQRSAATYAKLAETTRMLAETTQTKGDILTMVAKVSANSGSKEFQEKSLSTLEQHMGELAKQPVSKLRNAAIQATEAAIGVVHSKLSYLRSGEAAEQKDVFASDPALTAREQDLSKHNEILKKFQKGQYVGSPEDFDELLDHAHTLTEHQNAHYYTKDKAPTESYITMRALLGTINDKLSAKGKAMSSSWNPYERATGETMFSNSDTLSQMGLAGAHPVVQQMHNPEGNKIQKQKLDEAMNEKVFSWRKTLQASPKTKDWTTEKWAKKTQEYRDYVTKNQVLRPFNP